MIFIHKYSTGGTYMFKKIKEFFTGKPAEVVVEIPYKIEVAPVPVAEPVVEVATTSVIEAKPVKAKKSPAVKKTPAVKKPRAPKKTKPV
jgi:hypothetical protein